MNWERRLPPAAEKALEILASEANNSDTDGFSADEAMAVLVAHEFSKGDAEYALDTLEKRGYIYYADTRLHLTPTDD